MCGGKRSAGKIQSHTGTTNTTCFTCTRLNSTTFVIVEEDKWDENPFIYVKLYDNTLVVVDTGCGGATKNGAPQVTSLRQFIEIYPVKDNGNSPLNQGGERDYVVLCTLCHYDHIGT
jgi:glyoxylase-like metal-dependent hydrolase (beta-lactamase superfamily II)